MHVTLPLDDPDYPSLLRRTPDAPRALHVDGAIDALWHPSIAIVGSRNATPGGFDNARQFARAFARAGWCVVSGMALGIDTAAHLGALDEGGATVAVLGTAIDVAYPRRNAGLMRRIAASGAVVSEYPPGTKAHPGRFPARNRIVAALSLGTLVVEAAHESGALITARLAGDAGREVFALPGSIHNPMSRGCHRLLRDGATLVESPGEIIAALAPIALAYADDLRGRLHAPNCAVAALQHASPSMDANTQRLWEALGHDPTPMEALVLRTGLTAAELVSMLLVMELEGRVVSEHGRYTRRDTHKAS
ncbi:DNA-processing protein DprA [Lysobacter sp. A6]|uniref:DNA-processing protein DprA n=1 Tax=Noviluteimonas lactosilytica TaxID=2888523 RepID=A0ABS8JH62_9GAMM|nr:DNA-processing protein DprA [Lysobacter lactosilyticus]MCC8362939.1 DNA-processing protein DprA [Lysobacter lactosilyticus]